MKNQEIANILYEIADILEIKNVNWKPRAYRKAAQSIEALTEPIEDIYTKGGISALEEIPGVGKRIAEKIAEYIRTNKIKEFEKLKSSLPEGLSDLLEISSLGPKKVMVLYKKLKITNINQLEQAIQKHKLRSMPNFGEKTEENLLKGIELFRGRKARVLLGVALPTANSIVNQLKKLKEVHNIQYAGSLRRMKETIGDVDVLVTSPKPEKVMNAFTSLPEVSRVLAKGETKAMVILRNGMQADIRVVADKSFGAALQYFTGSKEHNVALRGIAIKKGYKLNEYGLFKRTGQFVIGKTENEIYKKLGMSYIEPELRENTGEIELAKQNKLPKLVELKDIKGDLHVHTKWSDGSEEIATMIEAAENKGYEYIAITDHSKSEHIANGMEEKRILKQLKEIEKLRNKFKINILTGSEVDILADGSLDYSDFILKQLDIVVASVHSRWKMTELEMTKRITKALENPYTTILGHSSGRLIGKREPYAFNLEEVLETAKKNNKMVEINSQPERLDLNDKEIKTAINMGVKLVISTDSHNVPSLDLMQFGVAQARRGFAEKKNIINTLPFKDFKKYIKRV